MTEYLAYLMFSCPETMRILEICFLGILNHNTLLRIMLVFLQIVQNFLHSTYATPHRAVQDSYGSLVMHRRKGNWGNQ